MTMTKTLLYKHTYPNHCQSLAAPAAKDSLEKLQSSECRAALEAIASMIAVDIAEIEARHSSNRELTLRARGWYCSLPVLSSKFVMQTVSKLYGNHDDGTMDVQMSDDKPDETRKKSSKGGGGAWRAFLHSQSAGRRFTRETLEELSNTYRSLSAEQRAFYAEAGEKAALAHRQGFASFVKKDKRVSPIAMVPQPLQIGEETPGGAIVAADLNVDPQDILTYTGPDFFLQRFEGLTQQIRDYAKTNKDPCYLNKAELQELSKYRQQAAEDDSLQDWSNAGHSFLSNGFGKVGTVLSNLVSLQWVPDIISLVKDRVFVSSPKKQ